MKFLLHIRWWLKLHHFGGSKYILRIHPVAKLNSNTLQEMILAALVEVDYSGGKTISCVCDIAKQTLLFMEN